MSKKNVPKKSDEEIISNFLYISPKFQTEVKDQINDIYIQVEKRLNMELSYPGAEKEKKEIVFFLIYVISSTIKSLSYILNSNEELYKKTQSLVKSIRIDETNLDDHDKKNIEMFKIFLKGYEEYMSFIKYENVRLSLFKYFNYPEYFNTNFVGNSNHVNEGKLLMEYYSECVDGNKDLSGPLKDYFNDCFKKFLGGHLTFKRAFNLTERNKPNPYDYPEYLEDIFKDILDKDIPFQEAFRKAQLNGVDKNEKTISGLIHKYARFLFISWIKNKIFNYSKNRIKEKGITPKQQRILKNSFNIDVNLIKYSANFNTINFLRDNIHSSSQNLQTSWKKEK